MVFFGLISTQDGAIDDFCNDLCVKKIFLPQNCEIKTSIDIHLRSAMLLAAD
jgi:hypothetical protein